MNVHCPLILVALLAAARVVPAQDVADSATVVRVLTVHDGRVVPQVLIVAHPADSSGRPVANAGRPAAVLTDDGGRATVRLAADLNALVASRLGFVPETLVVSRARASGILEIELEEASSELEEIVVTSTRGARRVEDEPLRVEVLPREEIEEKLLMTPGDITMMLNETGGLRVQVTSPSLGAAGVRIQGLPARYAQVLADGLPLHGETGSLGLLQIPPMDLGQVEIIKGPASALYGSAALGGVINLISRQPARARELLVNRTSRGGTDVVGYLSDEVGRGWGYSVLASGHRQREEDVDGDEWVDLPSYDRGVVRPRLFWWNGTGASAFVTAGATLEDRAGGTVEGGFVPGGFPFTEWLRTRRYDGGAVLRLVRGRDLFALRGSTTNALHRHRFGAHRADDRHRTGFAEASWTRGGDRLSTVVGVAWERETYDDLEPDPNFVGDPWDHDFRVPGVFGQLDFTPASWLALSASARFDSHSEYGGSLSPRLSALLRPGAWTVRVSAGGGVSGPSAVTELTEQVGTRNARVYPALHRERASSAALDVGRLVGPLELNATLFTSRVEDPVVSIVYPDQDDIQVRNALQPLKVSGSELLARWRREPFAITGTWAFTDATEPVPFTRSELRNARRRSVLVPRHTASLVAMLEEHDVGRAGLELHYTGAQALEDDPYRDTSPGYLLVGLLVERRFGVARLFVNGENLLDVRQTRWDPLVRPDADSIGRWTTDAWAPLDGRTVNAGVRFSF